MAGGHAHALATSSQGFRRQINIPLPAESRIEKKKINLLWNRAGPTSDQQVAGVQTLQKTKNKKTNIPSQFHRPVCNSEVAEIPLLRIRKVLHALSVRRATGPHRDGERPGRPAALCQCDPPTKIRLPAGCDAGTSRIRGGSGHGGGGVQERRGAHKNKPGPLGRSGVARQKSGMRAASV